MHCKRFSSNMGQNITKCHEAPSKLWPSTLTPDTNRCVRQEQEELPQVENHCFRRAYNLCSFPAELNSEHITPGCREWSQGRRTRQQWNLHFFSLDQEDESTSSGRTQNIRTDPSLNFRILSPKDTSACMLSHFSRVQLYRLEPTRLLCPWDFPGKNTGVGCHGLLQGIFATQGSNLNLLQFLHCRWILYCWATRETQENNLNTQVCVITFISLRRLHS